MFFLALLDSILFPMDVSDVFSQSLISHSEILFSSEERTVSYCKRNRASSLNVVLVAC